MTEPAPDLSDPLWPAWRALASEFKFSRMLWHLSSSRAGMGVYGVDVVTGLRDMKTARSAMPLLMDAPIALLDRLADLAALNARRNEALWRMAALFYASVPVTLLLAGLEGAPEQVQRFLRDAAPVLVVIVGMMTGWLLYYFASHWRARQIEAVIELARIQRGWTRRGTEPERKP